MKLVCLSLTVLALVAVVLAITDGESGPSKSRSALSGGAQEPLGGADGPGAVSWSDLVLPTEPLPDSIVISPGPGLCFVDGTEMQYPKAMKYLHAHRREIVAVHLVLWKAETKGDQLVLNWLNETGIPYSAEHHQGVIPLPDEDLPFVGD